MEDSKIEWTTHTFNPWIGCTKVSAGCDHCYAEELNTRHKWSGWGPKGKRVRTAANSWARPAVWNRKAVETGIRARVFCASLADVFDHEAPAGAREGLFALIRATPMLDWQLLTKRPQNFQKFLPADWGGGYKNVWLGISAENQKTYDLRWPVLRDTPSQLRFVSYEPALGRLSIMEPANAKAEWARLPDWVIWGGESGPDARPMEIGWARKITAECVGNLIPVFGKQWGSYKNNPLVRCGGSIELVKRIDPPSNGKGGAVLDGQLWREFPVQLAAV